MAIGLRLCQRMRPCSTQRAGVRSFRPLPRIVSVTPATTPLRFANSSTILARGLKHAAEIGELLLKGRSLAIWRKALTDGPPEALDVTLTSLRLPDDVAPETSIIWAPAAALAAVPRPFVRLIGLTSRAWPRHASEDPLLPDHIVPSHRLEPLPVHDADRRDFETICRTTARQLVCSRSRRDAEGRLNGTSPLYTANLPEAHRQRARIPEHAAGWSDRLFARPAEFDELPQARSALLCWIDWHTGRLTPNDGLIRRDHPVVIAALQRQQSATSLAKLLRDPLGYLWQYGFGWAEPGETEDPLLLAWHAPDPPPPDRPTPPKRAILRAARRSPKSTTGSACSPTCGSSPIRLMPHVDRPRESCLDRSAELRQPPACDAARCRHAP